MKKGFSVGWGRSGDPRAQEARRRRVADARASDAPAAPGAGPGGVIDIGQPVYYDYIVRGSEETPP